MPSRQQAGKLTTDTKLEWCQQVLSALTHVRETLGTCYTDLRPDNVLLSTLDGKEQLILCDFEQRGNWHEYCAPHVLFRQYIENIRSANPNPSDPRLKWLLDRYAHADESSPCYTASETVVQAKNRPWFALSSEQQEAAMIYSFGLFMYAIFEGVSGVRKNIANLWPYDQDIEFPKFKNAPMIVQDLIRRCTVDAPEWAETRDDIAEKLTPPRPKRVVRIGDRLCVEGMTSRGRSTVMDDTIDAAMTWWTTELNRAANFSQVSQQLLMEPRITLKALTAELDKLISCKSKWAGKG